jgi:hypothetical protein
MILSIMILSIMIVSPAAPGLAKSRNILANSPSCDHRAQRLSRVLCAP